MNLIDPGTLWHSIMGVYKHYTIQCRLTKPVHWAFK